MERPKPAAEKASPVSAEMLARGLDFLRGVEADYKAGVRTMAEVLYFTNKMQELFFRHAQEKSDHSTMVPYSEYAKLDTLIDESGDTASFTRLLQTEPTVSLLTDHTDESTSHALETTLSSLKGTLSQVLRTYRAQITASSSLALEAQQLIENPDVLPSEILEMTNRLLDHSFDSGY